MHDPSRAPRVAPASPDTIPCAVCGGPVGAVGSPSILVSVGRGRTMAHLWHFYDAQGYREWDCEKNTNRFIRAIRQNGGCD